MGNPETPEERIRRLNQEVAALQRAGKVAEGVKLADQAFFAAIEELPEGHFLRAQSARNRGIMYQMSGDNAEAYKTLLVALDWYGKSRELCIARLKQLESAGDLRGAKSAAQERLELTRSIEQLQALLFGAPKDE